VTAKEAEAILGVEVEEVVAPETDEALADLVKNLAKEQRRFVVAGSGTKLRWGDLPKAPSVTVVQTTGLDQITDHDPANLTVSVQSGVRYAALQRALGEHGQWLPLDSPWGGDATLGGIVAAAACGPRRYGYGAPRDLVLGVRLVLPDGSQVHFGGKTVKNVAGYDVTKLLVGSYGTLGLLTEVTFRLRPLPQEERSLVLTFATPDSLDVAVEAVLRSPDPVVAVEALGTRATGLLRSEGAPVPDGAYLLALRLEGTRPVLQAAVDRLASDLGPEAVGGKAAVLESSDSAAFWNKIERLFYSGWQQAKAVLKLRGPVRNAVGVLAALEPVEAGLAWVGAGTGVGYLKIDSPEVDLVSLFREVRSVLGPLRARVDLLAADPAAKRELSQAGIPLWSVSDTLLARMRDVKKIFDPGNLLAPGRFVGGI